jgi:hypothetical protein
VRITGIYQMTPRFARRIAQPVESRFITNRRPLEPFRAAPSVTEPAM